MIEPLELLVESVDDALHHLRGLLLPEHAQVVHPREHVVVHSLALLARPSEAALSRRTEMLTKHREFSLNFLYTSTG